MNDKKNQLEDRVVATNTPDYFLLLLGVLLLLIPLGFVVANDEAYDKAGFFLRLIASLGAGLMGGSLPGFLHLQLPFARAGGALALVLLVYAVNPPKQSIEALLPRPSPGEAASRESYSGPEKDLIDSATEDVGLSIPLADPTGIAKNNAGTSTPAVSQIEAAPEKTWTTVLATSWVKPSDWLGRHYFLAVEDNLYVWPVEIDKENRRANFIINTNKSNRTSGKLFDNVWITESEYYPFTHNKNDYRLTLVDIKRAGKLPTDAAYIKVEKYTPKPK